MIGIALDTIWDQYNGAWSDISSQERGERLTAAVRPGVVFSSPTDEGDGVESLISAIEDFQRKFPGACFQTDSLFTQHDHTLAQWTMRSRDGSALLQGATYAHYTSEGKIDRLAGFWAS